MAHRSRPTHRLALAALATVIFGACADEPVERVATGAVESITTVSLPTTTTAAPTTTTTAKGAKAPPAGLGPGAKGPQVQALEERLAAMQYDPGKVDGTFDSTTGHAVMAFQKVNGLHRTGRATDDVLAALPTASIPPPMVPGGGALRVEVDLKRQVLFLYKDDALARILSASTGNNKRYCVDGDCDVAVTPGGSFRTTWKKRGDHVSKLGHLYDPVFFNGGIAIHGSPSVPAHPASHGCVRIPMHASRWVHDQLPRGTPVYVLGGKVAPVPFNEPAPNEPRATTTTVKPTTSTTVAPTTTSTPTSTTTTLAP